MYNHTSKKFIIEDTGLAIGRKIRNICARYDNLGRYYQTSVTIKQSDEPKDTWPFAKGGTRYGWNPAGHVGFLFGGYDRKNFFDDTWIWKHEKWVKL